MGCQSDRFGRRKEKGGAVGQQNEPECNSIMNSPRRGSGAVQGE